MERYENCFNLLFKLLARKKKRFISQNVNLFFDLLTLKLTAAELLIFNRSVKTPLSAVRCLKIFPRETDNSDSKHAWMYAENERNL